MTDQQSERIRAAVLFDGGHARPATRAGLAEFLWELPWLQIDVTGDWDALRWERIAPYDVLITYTGNRNHLCTPEQLAGLQKFVEHGGGFVPLHFTTADANDEFIALVGARFVKHPPYGPFTVRIADPDHPITRGLSTIDLEDECYQSEFPNREALQVLQTSHHEAGIDGEPSSWVREIGRGRLFYSALGHDARTFVRADVRELFARGIRWAAGLDLVTL